MGEFFVEGPSALAFLQSVTSNDVSKLTNGKAQYSCFPNGKGGIVDDCIVYRIAEEKYMIVVNAGNLQKDWDWLVAQNTFGVNLRNDSDLYSLFSVSGPLAKATVQPLTDINLDNLAYYTFSIGKFNGLENVLIATTGYTGETCYEILIPNENAVDAWKAIMKSGEPHGIQPIGLGARDTLRLEMGYMLYGNDIDDTTSPLEAGLGWITKLDKGDFIDKAFLAQQKSEGLKKKLVGFEIVERGIPRHGYEIVNGDQVIGQVTSGTQSPSLQKGIGMGYVDAEFAKDGMRCYHKPGACALRYCECVCPSRRTSRTGISDLHESEEYQRRQEKCLSSWRKVSTEGSHRDRPQGIVDPPRLK
jgi:aminomethyltransferase